MCASSRALTIHDRHSVLPNTNVGAWVKRLLHCGGMGMSLSRGVGPEIECHSVCYSEEVWNEKDLSTLVWPFDGQPLPQFGPSFVVLHRLFGHLCFADRLIIGHMTANLSLEFRRLQSLPITLVRF